MAVTLNRTPSWFAVFGPNSTGATAWERANTSTVRFVRSQDQLAEWTPGATGRSFTAKETLYYFGEERLKQIFFEGSAILPPRPSEPSKTLRERREALGLTQTELANFVNLTLQDVAQAESPDYSNSIQKITKLAIALGLDDARIGFTPGAHGDKSVAVRLKAWRQDNRASAKTIATLSEIAWIITAQNRLHNLVIPKADPLQMFEPTDDYGNEAYPAWDVASDLARDTRELIGLELDEPIPSLRDFCNRLRIPLIHAQLNKTIAGATLATGDVRGIVVNVDGNDGNVWVQRATIAHELGHILWDPAERLKTLVVDKREQVEIIDRRTHDWVEARANAFAVELIAPKKAVRKYTGDLDIYDHEAISQAIRDNMVHFGLSATAMRYHLWNTFDRVFDITHLPFIDPEPTDEWKGREAYTDDFFVLPETPLNRRGHFAGVVAKAQEQSWLTEQMAALYLNTTSTEYIAHREDIVGLYAI